MTTTKESGVCPVCGYTFTLTASGVLRWHTNRDAPKVGGRFSPDCEGVGKPPEVSP